MPEEQIYPKERGGPLLPPRRTPLSGRHPSPEACLVVVKCYQQGATMALHCRSRSRREVLLPTTSPGRDKCCRIATAAWSGLLEGALGWSPMHCRPVPSLYCLEPLPWSHGGVFHQHAAAAVMEDCSPSLSKKCCSFAAICCHKELTYPGNNCFIPPPRRPLLPRKGLSHHPVAEPSERRKGVASRSLPYLAVCQPLKLHHVGVVLFCRRKFKPRWTDADLLHLPPTCCTCHHFITSPVTVVLLPL